MIAQAEFCPAQIGAILFTVRWTLEELGLDVVRARRRRPPQRPLPRRRHMPEHMLIKPVFHDGELVGFVANVAHMAEIGGKTRRQLRRATRPRSTRRACAPAGQDHASAARTSTDIWQIILANHRTPRNTWGDFHAHDRLAASRRAPRCTSCSTATARDFVDAGVRRADGRLASAGCAPRSRRSRTATTSSEHDGGRRRRRPSPCTFRVDRDRRRRRADRRLHRLRPAGARARSTRPTA